MAIKLNVKSVNIIWRVLPFQLRPDALPAASRRIVSCVPTYRQLRPDMPPAASPRSSGGIGCPVTSCGGYLMDRRKGKNVNVNVNLKCFSMLPEGEAYNRV